MHKQQDRKRKQNQTQVVEQTTGIGPKSRQLWSKTTRQGTEIETKIKMSLHHFQSLPSVRKRPLQFKIASFLNERTQSQTLGLLCPKLPNKLYILSLSILDHELNLQGGERTKGKSKCFRLLSTCYLPGTTLCAFLLSLHLRKKVCTINLVL